MKFTKILLAISLSVFSMLCFAKININTATAAELMQLHNIAEKKAQAIIAYREAHGAFKTIEELANVKGISLRMVKEFADEITLTGETKKETKEKSNVQKMTNNDRATNHKETKKTTVKDKK